MLATCSNDFHYGSPNLWQIKLTGGNSPIENLHYSLAITPKPAQAFLAALDPLPSHTHQTCHISDRTSVESRYDLQIQPFLLQAPFHTPSIPAQRRHTDTIPYMIKQKIPPSTLLWKHPVSVWYGFLHWWLSSRGHSLLFTRSPCSGKILSNQPDPFC